MGQKFHPKTALEISKAQDFKPADYVEKSLPTLDSESSIGDPLVIDFAKYVAGGGYELSRRIAKRNNNRR